MTGWVFTVTRTDGTSFHAALLGFINDHGRHRARLAPFNEQTGEYDPHDNSHVLDLDIDIAGLTPY